MNRAPQWQWPLKVIINAQFSPHSGGGGLETVLVGLICALGELDDGTEEYIIVGPWDSPECWKKYLGPNMRLVSGPKPPTDEKGRWLKKSLGPFLPVARRLRSYLAPLPPQRTWPDVPVSNGFFESLGGDVIHFAYHDYVYCALPTIYSPHDLQHRHFPQFFEPGVLAWRETIYPAGCRLAQIVSVTSQWVKDDVVDQYGINPKKVQIIPWAAPTRVYATPTIGSVEAVMGKYHLIKPFALYPAMTYEHKNHLRLLESLALLRDRHGLQVNLICTGDRKPFYQQIEKRMQELSLQDHVKFLGMVSPEELRALYHIAQFVIIPTLFEAASGPLFEAWQDGAPAACSTVTSLPEQAGDAALLFDPYSVEEIANAVAQMATDQKLREKLKVNGARRLQDFSWERTARAYRALYRRGAGRPLSTEDQRLLNWDWMRNPEHKKEVVTV
ncbi:MAG: D-inositol-3-phosphate glycosyltransferase [Gammaproteobacteria bacterium]|nr:D-inositol-3-phosphate glycosyltransferase [Gammaproteobacteria bacterium]